MENITFKTSMAYDAMCVCALDENFKELFLPPQSEISQKIEEGKHGTFEWSGISFSNLNEILYTYDVDSADWSLKELKRFFETANSAIPETANVQAIINNLEILEKLGFESFWHEKIHTAEAVCITKLKTMISGCDLSELFRLISVLKNTESANRATVFISAMSHPISFSLSNNAFVYCVPDEYDIFEFLSMIAHELMHGFASEELVSLYRNFMDSCHFLRSSHRSLINEWYSGDEEEFVMAAEYYLLYRAGIMSRKQIISRNWNRYSGNVPLALYIFELIHEKDIENYDNYLKGLFLDGIINRRTVIPTIEKMLSEQKCDRDNFYNRFFFWAHCCISVIRDVQTDDIPDLAERMAKRAKSDFKPNTERNIKFIKTERVIESESILRKTLNNGSIKIETVTFDSKQDAFNFGFRLDGSNVGACPVEYKGETFNTPYIINLTFPKNEPLRAEFSFVCGSTRYLITAKCPDHVISYDKYGRDVIENYAEEIIAEVKKASEFILMLDE